MVPEVLAAYPAKPRAVPVTQPERVALPARAGLRLWLAPERVAVEAAAESLDRTAVRAERRAKQIREELPEPRQEAATLVARKQ
jgi:hypothetical protein